MSPNAGGGEGGVAGSKSTAGVHRSPNQLWRSNSIFNLWLPYTCSSTIFLRYLLYGCSLYINSLNDFILKNFPLFDYSRMPGYLFARFYKFLLAAAMQAVCVRRLQGQPEQLPVRAGVCAALRRRDCYRRTTAGHTARSSPRNR